MPEVLKQHFDDVASGSQAVIVSGDGDFPSKSKQWTPASCIGRSSKSSSVPPHAVLVLNQPIENEGVFVNVCREACYLIAADGGLNRLRDLDIQDDKEGNLFPDAVCGDLDSVRKDVLDHYVEKGMSVSEDPDQYATDFTKCLRYINKRKSAILKRCRAQDQRPSGQGDRSNALDVFVFGGLGGRADQAFSQLHHLYLAREDPELECGDIYLITPESIIFLLHKGMNVVDTAMSHDQLGENIGIIPICRPSTISTWGLEWDVKDWQTEFGKQISTSNHIRNPIVKVHTSEPVLFTVEIGQRKNEISQEEVIKEGI